MKSRMRLSIAICVGLCFTLTFNSFGQACNYCSSQSIGTLYTQYISAYTGLNLNFLGNVKISDNIDLDGHLQMDQSTMMSFGSELGAGGNGLGTIYHDHNGFVMQAPGYGSDWPHTGGDIKLYGGLSEDYRGGDIAIYGGSGLSRNGNVYLGSIVGVGFGEGATLQSTLDVNGSVRATSFITVSDRNLKKNISSLDNSLQKISQLRGVSYSFKNDENQARSLPKEKQIGLIAQEVEKVIPEAVFTDATGLKGIDYNKVIPYLIEAIKAQQVELEFLRGEADAKKMMSNSASTTHFNRIKLFQNSPNPFNESTSIRYELTDGISNASLFIFDMQGLEVKRIEVPTKSHSIEIKAGELSAGMYLYSLVVDGSEIDTKRMILTR